MQLVVSQGQSEQTLGKITSSQRSSNTYQWASAQMVLSYSQENNLYFQYSISAAMCIGGGDTCVFYVDFVFKMLVVVFPIIVFFLWWCSLIWLKLKYKNLDLQF